jgi:Right handed beta helix region
MAGLSDVGPHGRWPRAVLPTDRLLPSSSAFRSSLGRPVIPDARDMTFLTELYRPIPGRIVFPIAVSVSSSGCFTASFSASIMRSSWRRLLAGVSRAWRLAMNWKSLMDILSAIAELKSRSRGYYHARFLHLASGPDEPTCRLEALRCLRGMAFSLRSTLPVLPMIGLLLLAYLGFCNSSTSPAFAKKKDASEDLFVNRGATHFVATSGNDDGPGTAERPWATVNYAAEQAGPGDTIIVRGGHYVLPAQVRLRHSGRPDAWITFMGYRREEAILDARLVQRPASAVLNNGAFQIEGVSFIRVVNLRLINSHDAGFTVRDSNNVDLINNSTQGTFSSGIAVWDTNHEGKGANNIRIIGNTITYATTWDLAPPDMPRKRWAPHEALSIGGAVNFEVAYNHVYGSDNEGIDIKETSKRGKVHHNLVHNVGAQGIYVDAWFGEIDDIEIFSNVVHDCRGAGMVVSVENGQSVSKVAIHNNLVFNNDGSGMLFSRWGVDNVRRNIEISNNVFYHNGYGPAKPGQTYHWLTGGLYLYSTNIYDILIRRNIFSDNRGFQIGYSELFLKNGRSWPEVAQEHGIQITGNLIDGRNTTDLPIKGGGAPADQVDIYAVNGDAAVFGSPLFKDSANQDFTLRRGSPAAVGHIAAGAYAPGSPSHLWWKRDFPPRFVRGPKLH